MHDSDVRYMVDYINNEVFKEIPIDLEDIKDKFIAIMILYVLEYDQFQAT